MSLGQLALVSILIFAALLALAKRMSRAHVVSIVVVVGSLLLPDLVAIDITGIPSLDKEAFTYAAALLAGVLASGSIPLRVFVGMEAPIVALLALSTIATVLLNPDRVMSNGVLQDSLGIQDLTSQSLDLLIYIWLPFVTGRVLIRSFAALITVLRVLAIGGLCYGLLALVEIAISVPFGSFQFACSMYDVCSIPNHRWGTIQPVLFMENVLSLATFLAGATIAMAGLRWSGVGVLPALGPRAVHATLGFCVLACKNVASVLYSGSVSIAMAFLQPRALARAAGVVAVLVLVYPFARARDLVPVEAVVTFAGNFDKERMISLYGRFMEEEIVLDTMSGRFWFGWGTLDRVPDAMVFKSGEFEGVTGGDAGIDPYWVIVLGSSGMIGLELRLMVMLLPVIAWSRRAHGFTRQELIIGTTVALIIAVRSADLILNGLWNNLPLFLAGALHGGAQATNATAALPPEPPLQNKPARARRSHSLAKRLR